MARRSSASAPLSPSQAAYVLERLIQDGQVSRRDVRAALSSMNEEIRSLEERLAALRAAGHAPADNGTAQRGRRGRARQDDAPAAGKRRRRTRITESQRKSRVLQGQYLSLIRRIPPGERAKIKKIAESSGREAAIQQMRQKLGA